VVTGAGSGIGEEVAVRLAADGMAVAAWDVDGEAALRTAARIERAAGTALAVIVDVTEPAEVAEAARRTAAALGTPTVLVNVAGIRELGSLLDTSTESWRRVLAVNLDGVFYCTREVGRLMAGRGGSIVNVASTAAMSAMPERASYCASKAGVAGFTRAAAVDLAPHGIRVNALAPGATLTPLTRPREHAPEIQELIRRTPLGRWGQSSEIAEVVAFLAGEASSFVTGTVIPVDGGAMAGTAPPRAAGAASP
jgi:NAD(P)-dependent dehydrogenase (short-subunit alcohol dehydrogenase family)